LTLFTEKQRQVYIYDRDFEPEITILHGAIRTGKTVMNNWLWVKHVSKFRGKKFIMTGYTIPALKKNVLDEIESTFGIDCNLDRNNEFKLFGNTICCFGADDKDAYKAMRGLTAYGWYGNEITLQHKNTVDQAFKRCSGKGARIFWDTNPDSPTHPVKVNYIDKSGQKLDDGRVFVKAWHFRLEDNSFLDPVYIARIKEATPSGVFTDRDIEGLWVAAEGIIYRDYSPALVVDKLPEMKRYFGASDWGFEHPGVLIVFGEDHDGNDYIVEIVKEQYKDVDEFWKPEQLRLIKKYPGLSEYDFYCDSARPEYVKKFNGQNADKSVVEGIAFVSARMKGRKLFIYRPYQKLVEEEIYSYIWKPGSIKEEPIKTADDIMDAIRYGLYTDKNKPAPVFQKLNINIKAWK